MTLLNSPFDFTARHDAESKRDLVPDTGLTLLPGDAVRLKAGASVAYTVEKFAAPNLASTGDAEALVQPAAPIWVIISGNSELEYNPTGKVVGISKDMKFTTERFNPARNYNVGDYVTVVSHADYAWDRIVDMVGDEQRVGVVTKVYAKEGTNVLDIELVA
jgi:hypothetical protein